MTTHEQIPPPPESTVRLRSSTLDPRHRSPTVARVGTGDARTEEQRTLLRTQPWGRILKQLTAIAFKRIRGRSLSDAQDLAQSAIADAYRAVDGGGWDPQRGPLMGFLVARVIASASDERRRKRNTCEVWLDQEDEDEEGPVSRYEKHLGADEPPADQALHRLRLARTFHDRLVSRVAADPLAIEVITQMKDGVSKPRDLGTATGRPLGDIVEARRRIRYHASEVTKELSASAGSSRADSRSKGVTQ
jgi:DNA-directed RNA polymerase specialized sigma24 family protein